MAVKLEILFNYIFTDFISLKALMLKSIFGVVLTVLILGYLYLQKFDN